MSIFIFYKISTSHSTTFKVAVALHFLPMWSPINGRLHPLISGRLLWKVLWSMVGFRWDVPIDQWSDFGETSFDQWSAFGETSFDQWSPFGETSFDQWSAFGETSFDQWSAFGEMSLWSMVGFRWKSFDQWSAFGETSFDQWSAFGESPLINGRLLVRRPLINGRLSVRCPFDQRSAFGESQW